MQAKTPNDMMVWTWCGWEPLQYYRRLGGFHEQQEGNAHWAEDWRALLDSEECAAKLAEAGINWVTTRFYKGMGLASETEAIAAVEKMIANYHKHGVNVFTYIQYGTIMPESIAEEGDEPASWGRLDWNGKHDGHPYEYGDQYWRAKPCANQPAFIDYLAECVDRAIDIGADGIWIDNLNADGCHCEYCQQAFQDHLHREIDDPWRELGLKTLDRVRIPRAERPKDPVFQAWVRFRVEETRHALNRLAARARECKPDVVFAVNVGIGNHQRALIENGNWFGNLDRVDVTYAENPLFPGWRNGEIVSQHWPMGICESIGIGTVPGAGVPQEPALYPRPTVPGQVQLRRSFAESAIFGGKVFGGPFGLRGEDGGAEPILLRDAAYRSRHRELVDWYAERWPILADSVNTAPVAVCYSREAMTGDETAARQAFDAAVQFLQRRQIPFRYILSDQLEKQLADGVKLLVLPHILPMTDAQAETIRAFVNNGGRVLATGRTSLYDETMRQRRDYALADVFGTSFSRDVEDVQGAAIHHHLDNGCALIPGAWGVTLPDGRPGCRLENERLAGLLRDLTAENGTPKVVSPAPTVGVALRKLSNGRLMLGLLNYADTPVAGIELHNLKPGSEMAIQTLHKTMRRQPDADGRLRLPNLEIEMLILMREA